jgi:hypothetical protein
MPDVKLGCHISPPRDRARMLKVADFRAPLPVEPPVRDWFAKTTGQELYQNDVLGICTRANKWNLIRVWTANAGNEFVAPVELVLKDYEDSGYIPGKPETDQGDCLSEVLKRWQNIGIGGHKIGPYLAVDPTDWEEVCFSLNMGIATYCGLSLPQSAMDAMDLPEPRWDMPENRAGKRIIGGHCVLQAAYDLKKEEAVTGTWAKKVPTSADFIGAYFSEMYLIFSEDFMKDGVAPNGFNGQAILDAMEQVKRRDPGGH